MASPNAHGEDRRRAEGRGIRGNAAGEVKAGPGAWGHDKSESAGNLKKVGRDAPLSHPSPPTPSLRSFYACRSIHTVQRQIVEFGTSAIVMRGSFAEEETRMEASMACNLRERPWKHHREPRDR